MSKHDDDTCPHLVRASLLEAENARLKAFNDEALAHIAKEERKSRERLDMAQAEVERLKNLVRYWSEKYQNENARFLRADDMCKKVMSQHSDISCENIMLRKAGDAMASSIQFNEEMAQDYNGPTIVHQCVQRWNAAKEGKQS